MEKNKILAIALLMSAIGMHAQQTIDASGGNASGSNGNVSYSIGQIAYLSASGPNGSVSQGVQQPYEISTLGVDNFPHLNLEMSVYPNPTTSVLFLKFPEFSKNAQYKLFDSSGRMVKTQGIKNPETQVEMSSYTSGIYILQVAADNQIIKTFKIIKK